MSNGKNCPFFKENCLGVHCEMWIKAIYKTEEKDGKAVISDSYEGCAIILSGFAALKEIRTSPYHQPVLSFLRT